MTKGGFCVKTDSLKEFFTEKLSYMGLNEKEIADFNEFWIPLLSEKPYAFIYFYDQDRIDREAPLTVSPKPDTVIRVYFDHKLLDEPVETKPQKLKEGKRKGFTVVEWGGRRYK